VQREAVAQTPKAAKAACKTAHPSPKHAQPLKAHTQAQWCKGMRQSLDRLARTGDRRANAPGRGSGPQRPLELRDRHRLSAKRHLKHGYHTVVHTSRVNEEREARAVR
jgi:transcription initiation factor TFIID subunit TAF12